MIAEALSVGTGALQLAVVHLAQAGPPPSPLGVPHCKQFAGEGCQLGLAAPAILGESLGTHLEGCRDAPTPSL